MPSFDIVSNYDVQEIENSVNMVTRDVNNRYDFKGSNSKIHFNKKEESIILETDSEIRLDVMRDMLEKRAIGRKISIKTFEYGSIEIASGKKMRQSIQLQHGISKEKAKIINKLIKDSKLKVNAQIQDNKIRVIGKKIDDLQLIINLLREKVTYIPLQFINLKK